MKKVRITLWSIVAVAVAIAGGFWVSERGQIPIAAARVSVAESLLADFELTDHNGMMQVDEDFRGRWILIFFGLSNSPDDCPMSLATIAQVMGDLGAKGEAVQPLFTTVDPERDMLNVLASYIPQFGPNILGLSGPQEQIQHTAKAIKICYQRTEDEAAPDGYTMRHTSSFLLLDPQCEFVRISSVFGRRKHPIYGNVRMHTGVDYAAVKGTPLSATAPGRVSFIGWQKGYGQVVEISHGSNTMTRYAHLSAVPNGLKTGNHVLAGEVIGQVGETGTATAPNLHYEVRIDGRPINPLGKELIASVENPDTAGASALLEKTRALFTATLSDEI